MPGPSWDMADREWVDYRTRELMSEGMPRVRAMATAVDELHAERRRASEAELIQGSGMDPAEFDRRIRDR
jgi:hypothetical protein